MSPIAEGGLKVMFVRLTGSLICLALIGCGGEGPTGGDVDLAPAEGIVTLQGSPLMAIRVTAIPDRGPIATGVTDSEGRFSLTTGGAEGVAVGTIRISVAEAGGTSGDRDAGFTTGDTAATQQAMQEYQQQYGPRGTGEASPPAESAIPEKYTNVQTSELSFVIKPGETNQLTIELN